MTTYHIGTISFIITASKHLQDQYSDDYPILYPVKGKSNFPCLKIMKEKKIEDKILASTLQLTCEKGKCEDENDRSTIKNMSRYTALTQLEKAARTHGNIFQNKENFVINEQDTIFTNFGY